MGRSLVLAVLLVALLPVQPSADSAQARRAVEAFLARLSGPPIVDLSIRQTVTLFHPDGRHPQSSGEQQLFIKQPRRQRLEQTIEGKQEIRLTVGDRVWLRREGVTSDARGGERDRSQLFTTFHRSADDLLAEWKSFGIRDDVTHVIRLRGRPVTVIGAALGDQSSPAVWLDEEYGVVRVVTHERLPQGRTLVDLTLSEHRPLRGGYHYPHRQELFANGKLLLRITTQAVAVDSNLSDDLFDPAILRRGG